MTKTTKSGKHNVASMLTTLKLIQLVSRTGHVVSQVAPGGKSQGTAVDILRTYVETAKAHGGGVAVLHASGYWTVDAYRDGECVAATTGHDGQLPAIPECPDAQCWARCWGR